MTTTIPEPTHPDDIAVDLFAAAMKEKMAASRAMGRSNWQDPMQCTVEDLQVLLADHVQKGDPVDVGNFSMMLWYRGATTKGHECVWRLENDESGTWGSACDELWSFIDGGPKENGVRYCHHCGRKVVLVQPS
jgi:hypothetical protein